MLTPTRGARAAAAAWLCITAACVASDDLGRSRGDDATLELHVLDWDGTERPLREVARRPRLRLEHPRGVAPDGEAIGLWPGPVDDDLLGDLERAPLRIATARARVPADLQLDDGGVALVPSEPLEAGARYTLAVGSWIDDASGRPLLAGDAAFYRELVVADTAEAGARVLASWPADGAAAIAPNLEAAWLAFDGTVRGLEAGLWLADATGRAVPVHVASEPCEELLEDARAVHCVELTPAGVLAGGAEHALVLDVSARDDRGAPLGPWRAGFRTAGSLDRTPPALLETPCELDEAQLGQTCALIDDGAIALRAQASEAVSIHWRGAGRGGTLSSPGGDFDLSLRDLAPSQQVVLELELHDAADNVLAVALEAPTSEPLATVSIVEVRADPRGPEPRQEFVELLNYGAAPVQLRGLALTDDASVEGDVIATSLELAPAARVLLVADAFDADDARDVQPPPGASLVRMGTSLGRSGLANAGERLLLRDAEGRRLSAAPALPAPGPGACLVRVSNDMRDGSPTAFGAHADDTCSPGS